MSNSSDHRPRITIGITAFNEGDWLADCWRSVRDQTEADWEAVIVLDGGADPRTRSIFDSIEHPQLRKIACEENHGPYYCRALAIQAANSNWYAHLDGDDRLPPNAVSLVLAAISNNPGAQFIFGDGLFFNDKKQEVHHYNKFNINNLVYGATILGQSPIHLRLYEQVGGFNTDLRYGGADWDFWIGVAELGEKGARADGVIYERRRRNNSVGDGWRLRRDEVVKTIIERHPDYFASEEQIRRCYGYAYRKMAMSFRALKRRKRAAECAEQAMLYGFSSPALNEVIHENKMPKWRYELRYIARQVIHKLR